MKRSALIALLCGLSLCCGVSCGSKDSSKPSESSAVSAETTAEASAEPVTEPVTESETEPAPETTTSPANVKIDVDAEAALRAYVQTAVTSSAEDIVKCIYPESIYNGIINSSAINVFGDGGDSDAGLEDLSVTKCIGLSPDPYYMAVQKYYRKTAEAVGVTVAEPIVVDRAYDVEATIKASYGGNVATDVVPAVVVRIDSVGWKTIPMSAAELLEVAE